MPALRKILAEHPAELAFPLAIFAIVMVVGWVARRFLLRALEPWTSRTGGRIGLILVRALRGPTVIWIMILALHLSIEASELPKKYTSWSGKVLLVLWIVSLTLMGMRMAGNVVRHYGEQAPGALPVTTLTQNLAQLTVLLVGIVLLMRSLGLEIAPILTALGVGGLAVALALQDTLSNLFGGFYVAIARQIRLGDYIKLNTGEEGYVTDIGWRSTMIRGLANNMVLIPNAKLAQAIVTNYYLPDKRMGTSVEVSVAYDCDLDHVEQILLEVGQQGAKEIPGMVADSAPSVTLDPGFGEWAVKLSLGFQVEEFSKQYSVRHQLRQRILRRFREEGIEIPLPARMVYMRSGKRREKSENAG